MRRQGEDLGVFTLEELRRRHESGELTGGEYIQGEGMPDWQPLDLVLQQGYRVVPPPLPSSVSKGGLNPGVIWLIVAVGVIFFIAFCAYVGINFQRGFQSAVNSNRSRRSLNPSSPEGVAAASKPVTWTTNTLTERDVQKRAREFRIRQWLDGYEKRGRRNPACDAEAEQFIRVYIARNYGGPEATNTLSLEAESDRLAQDPDCTDPLVLTVAADNSLNYLTWSTVSSAPWRRIPGPPTGRIPNCTPRSNSWSFERQPRPRGCAGHFGLEAVAKLFCRRQFHARGPAGNRGNFCQRLGQRFFRKQCRVHLSNRASSRSHRT